MVWRRSPILAKDGGWVAGSCTNGYQRGYGILLEERKLSKSSKRLSYFIFIALHVGLLIFIWKMTQKLEIFGTLCAALLAAHAYDILTRNTRLFSIYLVAKTPLSLFSFITLPSYLSFNTTCR